MAGCTAEPLYELLLHFWLIPALRAWQVDSFDAVDALGLGLGAGVGLGRGLGLGVGGLLVAPPTYLCEAGTFLQLGWSVL